MKLTDPHHYLDVYWIYLNNLDQRFQLSRNHLFTNLPYLFIHLSFLSIYLSIYLSIQGGANQANNLDQKRQELMQKRREIEERTLASSERGIGVLYESEKVSSLHIYLTFHLISICLIIYPFIYLSYYFFYLIIYLSYYLSI